MDLAMASASSNPRNEIASALVDISFTHQNLISGMCGRGKLAGTLPTTDNSVLPLAAGIDQPKCAASAAAAISANSISTRGRP